MSKDQALEVSKEAVESTSSSGSESEDELPVESLVAGRSKRVTAGNRLSSLLEKEGDDELELLFAEDDLEEDLEFEGADGEDASDVQLDSSSDDEDKGPTAGTDDLEGEKELEKLAKAERRKKRKAQELFKRPPASRNKVKVDPIARLVAPATPLARPKKKSERTSWLPAPEEGPVRSSSRKQTVRNKEVVHRRMQENEKRRRRQLQVMEAAAKRKGVSETKVMTQADRMAEAARTEKRNAKSLNRWEETEKKRVEDEKARLAALHSRQLQGPVVSLWSGPSKWVNGKLVAVGAKNLMKEVKDATMGGDETAVSTTIMLATASHGSTNQGDTTMAEAPPLQQLPPSTAMLPPSSTAVTANASQTASASQPAGPGFLDGIHYYASLTPSQQPHHPLVPGSHVFHVNYPAPTLPPPLTITEYATRNLVILENIDGTANRAPELQNHILLKKRNVKLQSKLAL